MAIDSYSPCPCGSGKKFKWCCQPFYDQIEKAFYQQANKQHDAALATMSQLTEKHANNAEVWGKQAELLWENGRGADAEKSLDKALEVNPNYAFGYFLRGMLRHEEGELRGALLLYRKAAAVCDPEAKELRGEIHTNIGQCEMLLNNPLAGLAAWEVALSCMPQSEGVQQLLQDAQAPGRFPLLVFAERRFQKPPPGGEQAWSQALTAGSTGKLHDALAAFEQLTGDRPEDAAAWYNLGLVRAWLGQNEPALEAFTEYVALEPDEARAAEAWTLAEVLRFGAGMQAHCDHLEYRVIYPIRDAQHMAEKLNNEQRFTDLQQGQGVLAGALLDRDIPTPQEHLALYEVPQVIAYVVIVGMRELRLLHSSPDLLARGRHAIEALLGPALGTGQADERPPAFTEVTQFLLSLRFPQGLADEPVKRLLDGYLQQQIEERWLQRPLKALSGNKPVDAAGHAGLRKKLIGCVDFLDNLTHSTMPFPYDFDRLRRKLDLPVRGAVGEEKSGPVEISSLGAAELAGLTIAELKDEELHEAFQTAQRLDASELAANFARQLTERTGGAADRFQLYQFLTKHAVQNDDAAGAHSWLDAGLKHDCEHNDGRRRNDYELRRARLHLEMKEPEPAYDVFKRLVERLPSDVEVLQNAAEGMLRANRRQHAAEFAEQGLKAAKQKGDRDRAGNFEELLAAARK